VKLWNVQAGNLKYTLNASDSPFSSVLDLVFSPDGIYLMSIEQAYLGRPGGYRMMALSLWDTRTSGEKKTLSESATISSWAFSPDSKYFASGSYKTIQVWEIPTERPKLVLEPNGEVLSIAFSPDGKMLASGGADNAVRLWDVQTGHLLQSLNGHNGKIYNIAFSPDGETSATTGDDRITKLWNTHTWKDIKTWNEPNGEVFLAMSSDWRTMVFRGPNNTLNMYFTMGRMWGQLKIGDEEISMFELSPDATSFAACYPDNKIKVTSM
jgi:WD40 repeat protein